MKKGTFVTYQVRRLTVEAVVRAAHRDGTFTVEARHELRDGKPHGCYLGYRYRMDRSDFRVAT